MTAGAGGDGGGHGDGDGPDGGQDRPRLRVLLVDDDINVLRALTWQLESIAEVTALTSVTAAIPLTETRHFDVVIADLRLPERWGDELLARVAARSPDTRRYLVTGDADPSSTVRELLEHGVIHAYFVKPSFAGLLELMRQLTPSAPIPTPAT
jgi:response regulator RpfG family c-di-GMP phosphodiesterase